MPDPQIDPWEARERERARYSQNPANRARGGDDLVFSIGSYLAAGLVAAVAALLIGESPFVPAALRSILTVGGSVIVLLLLASARSYADNLWVALRRGPNAFLLGLVLWSAIAYLLSPYRSVTGFGASELLRVLTGAGLYFLAAYGLRSPKEVANVTVGLIGVAVLVALADFLQMGETQGALVGIRDRNLFGTHENLGALLLLVLPISCAFALSGQIEEKRRLAAQVATLILVTSLLLARARSAWIGTAFAILLLTLLMLRFGPRRSEEGTGHRKGRGMVQALTSPLALIGIGLAVLISLSGMSTVIRSRASIRDAMRDTDISDRIVLWKAASRMTVERVWTGWGLGSYWLIEGRWTHIGDDMAEVLQGGAYQDNNAHDYYVQWAADTGAPGLFLYVGTVAAFLIAAARVDREIRQGRDEKTSRARPSLPPFQQLLLLACQASIAGAAVDAIASPAYMFHGISGVMWLVMGLGVAAMRPAVMVTQPVAEDAPAPIPALAPQSPLAAIGAAVPALAIVGFVLYVGHHQMELGAHRLRGVLEVIADPPGPIIPGQSLTWRAVFHDETGKEISTCPGTLWEFNADRQAVQGTKAAFARMNTKGGTLCYSNLQVTPPATDHPLTAHAVYFDAYGRRYDAWSEVNVISAAAAKKRAGKAGHHPR